MEPLVTLFEEPPAPPTSLPEPLARIYGGGLEVAEELVYANAVSSLDGVVTLGTMAGAPPLLSGRSEADHFVMGLLRALADCVLLGAGTLRDDPGHLWTPGYIHPPSAQRYAMLGRPAPRLVVVSASGNLNTSERALQANALVLTSTAGADRLAGSGIPTRVVGEPPFSARAILDAVRAEGHRRVLVEAGPTLLAHLVEARMLDELFLTLSPVLAGRMRGDGRLGLLEGVRLMPEQPRWTALRSVRRHGAHLFLRYAL